MNDAIIETLSPEKHGEAMAIRDVCNAILAQGVFQYDDLTQLAASMAEAYQEPTAEQWWTPPIALDGGEATPSDYPRGYDLQDVDSFCGTLVDEYSFSPANEREAMRTRKVYLETVQNAARHFSPESFDFWMFHFPLGGPKNLLDRLSDITERLLAAHDSEAVQKVVGQFEELLSEADRMSSDDNVLNWYATRNGDEESPEATYWRDYDRFFSELDKIEDEKRERLRKFDAAQDGPSDAYSDYEGTPDVLMEEEEDHLGNIIKRQLRSINERANRKATGLCSLVSSLPSVPSAAPSSQPMGGGKPATSAQQGALSALREDHPKPPGDPLDDPDPPRDPPGGKSPPIGSFQDRVIAAVEPLLNTDHDGLDQLDSIARALAATVASKRGSQDWTPFPLGCLPKPLADFVERAAASHSVDPAAVALPCLATLAAALGNSHRLRLKPDWEVPSVLWCILVARTGTNKSGPLSLAVRPMHDAPPMSMIEKPLLVPSQGQYVVDDATIEAVLARLSESSRGLLLHGEELSGWVASFDAYKKASGGDMQKWLRMWDVNTYRVDRKGSDERLVIPNPAVSIAGAIQPELLGKAVDPEKLVSGFFARTLCCMPPEQKRRWTNVGVDEQQTKFWRDLIDTLRTRPFASLNPDTSQFEPNIVTLDQQAHDCWVRYFGEISGRLDGSTGAERGIVAKADVQAARLALVLHGARCSLGETKWGEPMPESTMAKGVELGRWFLNETIRVFDRTCGEGQNQRQDSLMELAGRKGGKLTPRDVQRSNSKKYPSVEIAKNDLRNLANAGHGVFDGRIFTCGTQ